jgi:hypothetical protein
MKMSTHPAVPQLTASTGSACHSGIPEPSPVLTAMGVDRDRALGAVRLSLGRWTKTADIDRAADLLLAVAQRRTDPQLTRWAGLRSGRVPMGPSALISRPAWRSRFEMAAGTRKPARKRQVWSTDVSRDVLLILNDLAVAQRALLQRAAAGRRPCQAR